MKSDRRCVTYIISLMTPTPSDSLSAFHTHTHTHKLPGNNHSSSPSCPPVYRFVLTTQTALPSHSINQSNTLSAICYFISVLAHRRQKSTNTSSNALSSPCHAIIYPLFLSCTCVLSLQLQTSIQQQPTPFTTSPDVLSLIRNLIFYPH